MPSKRPFSLTIAGFDPSGGAGVIADCKTMEANKICAVAANSALTFQNDFFFEGVKWIPAEDIVRQIDILAKRFRFDVVKIGLIENTEVLLHIITYLQSINSDVKIIWDPILKASAGFVFHAQPDKERLQTVCRKIFLLTPNWEEIKILTGGQDEKQAALELSRLCPVFLKGGHNEKEKGKDFLFMNGKIYPFRLKTPAPYPKHGSGCVLSAAIAANLAKNFNLLRSCLRAKDYVTRFLMSNATLTGYHFK